jgi:hypothetical protein
MDAVGHRDEVAGQGMHPVTVAVVEAKQPAVAGGQNAWELHREEVDQEKETISRKYPATNKKAPAEAGALISSKDWNPIRIPMS